MMLTIEEVRFYLGVTDKWLNDVLNDGKSKLAVHTRCRRDEKDGKKRSPVRIPLKSLWLYIWHNTIPGRNAEFPTEPPENPGITLVSMDEIREWIYWYRCGRPELPGDSIRLAMAAEGIPPIQIDAVIGRLRKLPAFRNRIN